MWYGGDIAPGTERHKVDGVDLRGALICRADTDANPEPVFAGVAVDSDSAEEVFAGCGPVVFELAFSVPRTGVLEVIVNHDFSADRMKAMKAAVDVVATLVTLVEDIHVELHDATQLDRLPS